MRSCLLFILLLLAAPSADAGLGDELLAAGQYRAAIESFGRELATQPPAPEVAAIFLKMARCHVGLREPWLAEVRLRRLLREFPDAPSVYGGVALLEELLKARNGWSEAYHLADGLLASGKVTVSRAPLLQLKARAQVALGRDQEAARTWAILYKESQTDTVRRRITAEVRQWLRDRPQPLLRWVIREFDYEFPSDYALLAIIDHYRQEDPALAKRLTDHFLASFPGHPETATLTAAEPPPFELPPPTAVPGAPPSTATRYPAPQAPWTATITKPPRTSHRYDRQRIALLAPATGSLAPVGVSLLQGAQLAVERFNREDSVGDRVRVELQLIDTGPGEQQAATAFETLLANEPLPIAVLGPATSRAARNLAPWAEWAEVPLLTPSASANDLTAAYPYLYRHGLSDADQVRRLVDYAVRERKATLLAVLYPGNDYGRTFMEIFVEEARCAGAEVVAKASYSPTAVDFGREIHNLIAQEEAANGRKIRDLPAHQQPRSAVAPRMVRDEAGNILHGPVRPPELTTEVETSAPPPPHQEERNSALEAVFIPGTAEAVGLILPQLAYYGVEEAIWLGTEEWLGEELIRRGERFARRSLFTTGFFPYPGTPVQEFADAYQHRFGGTPDRLAAQAYETTRLVLTAIGLGVRTGPELQAFLAAAPLVDGIAGPLWVDTAGEIETPPLLLTVRQGRFVPQPETLPPATVWEPAIDPWERMGPPHHLWELPLDFAELPPEPFPEQPAPREDTGGREATEGMVPGLFEEDRWGIPIP